MAITQTNFPNTINGDNVIKYTNSKLVGAHFSDVDTASLETWYHEDPKKNYLGLVEPITRAEEIATPLLTSVLSQGGRIEVNGYDGVFTYDVPVSRETGVYTCYDTSGESIKPGIDGSLFRIGLTKEYAPGDVLSYDFYHGEQFVVSQEFPVFKEGDVWFHHVRHLSKDKRSWYPNQFLRPGIEYWKIGHLVGEFSTQLSKINVTAQMDYIGCEFQLGNTRGVEGTATMFAGDKYLDNLTVDSREFIDKVQAKQRHLGFAPNGKAIDTVIIGQMNQNGRFVRGSEKVLSLMEYMGFVEVFKMENYQLMFQKAGLIADANSILRANEGYYHQLRRGFRMEYSQPGNLPLNRLTAAAAYVYRGRRNVPIEKRRMKFKAGMMAYYNIIRMLTDQFNIQLQALSPLLGRDMLIKNPISGPNDALSLGIVRVNEVFVPTVGFVTVEHDPSLDYMPFADVSQRGFFGEDYPRSSYTVMIEDITSSETSNAFDGVQRTNLKVSNPNANSFYITPEQGSLSWGFQNGRYDFRTKSNIIASDPKLAQTFFCLSTSAIWVKDLSKHVLIELADSPVFY